MMASWFGYRRRGSARRPGNASRRCRPTVELLEERRLLAGITEFGAGISANSRPTDITLGADGNLWFTDNPVFGDGGELGRITPSGTVTEFSLAGAQNFGINVYGITSGPGGLLYFTEVSQIGSLNPLAGSDAAIRASLKLSAAIPFGVPGGITAGPDGNLWLADSGDSSVKRITPDLATVTDFPTKTSGAGPDRIVAGPDGALWFTEAFADKIGHITTSGTVTELPLPTKDSPSEITAGPDGALWFTEPSADRIGRISTSGSITLFPLASGTGPASITTGPDGNLWFTEPNRNQIGRISTDGAVTEYGSGITAGSVPDEIVTGPDGNLWFTENHSNRIGRLIPDAPLTASGVPVSAAAGIAFSGQVASFTDADTSAVPADFAVTIDWGDGTSPDTTSGTVAAVSGQPGSFVVSGRHTYAAAGNDTITVTITDTNTTTSVGGNTATATDAVVFHGSLQFISPGYSVNENGGSAAITLSRTGGATGAVSVQLSTGDGTATAGTDYTAVSQTVSWADGDGTPKTVAIPILDEGLTTGQRTVNLTLATPGGGATLGNPAAAVLTILDNDTAPTITSTDHATFTVGTAGRFSVTATGVPAPSLSKSSSDTLPAGITFDAASGLLSGTPAAGSAGTYRLHFTAHNGAGPDASQTFTLTVNQAPAFTGGSAATFTVSQAGSFTVTASGSPTPALTEAGDLPRGVTFQDNGDGTATFGGTPAVNTGGLYFLTLTAHNGVGSDATLPFALAVDQPAALTSASAATLTVGQAGSFTVTTTGFPKPSLTQTGQLPGGVTFQDNGDGTATLGGTPAAGTAATYLLTFTASNGVGGDVSQTFTLTVNQVPAITSVNTDTFTVGQAGSFTITTSGSPTPSVTATGLLPGGLAFQDNGDGTATLRGTPAAGSGGTYPLHVVVHNGVGSDATQTFTLIVDQPPAISGGNSTTFAVGTAGSFTVTATGFPVPTLGESGNDTLPGGISFNAATGLLSGTPAAGSGGPYTLHFTASNGVGSDAAQTFTLRVDEAATITSAASASSLVGSAGTFTVTAAGFPAPTLSESAGDTLPAGVTFQAATGMLSGTPAAGSAGPYTLHFTAHNGVGGDGAQTFTLTVDQVPAITSVASTTFTVGAAGSFTVAASGFPAPALSESPGDVLPPGVSFAAATGLLSGTPMPGSGGMYTLHFSAASSAGNVSQTFALTVKEPPAFSSPNGDTLVAGTAGSFRVTATGFPPPTLSASATDTLPPGLTFNPAVGGVGGAAVGLLSGTLAGNSGGSYMLHFAATNGVGVGAVQPFTLTVDQAPAFTNPTGAAFTAGSAGAFRVVATGFPGPALSESGALPAGITFDPVSGVLGGTPAPGMAGIYSLSFSAGNGVGNPATQAFTLTVTAPAPPVPPPITGPLNLAGLVGVSVGPLTPVGKRRKTGGSFTQTVTITNNGSRAIQGPVVLVLDSLTPRKKVRKKFVPQVAVAGAGGTTQAVSPGSPFVPGPALLPAGGTITFHLTFQRKGSGTITFNPILLAGYAQP
jgi:streptogramin lyase